MGNGSEGCTGDPIKKIKIKQVVKILLKDPTLLKNILKLSDACDCNPEVREQWGIQKNNGSVYEALTIIVNDYVSRHKKTTIGDFCTILEGEKFMNVAEKLTDEFKKNDILEDEWEASRREKKKSEIKWPITYKLKVPSPNFSGRKELSILNSYFEDYKNLLLICGFGGIGKTELCRKFANDILLLDKTSLTSRIWLRGETAETLRKSVLNLGEELGFENDGNLNFYFQNLCLFILENSSRLLVIIDNVDCEYTEVIKITKCVQNSNLSKMFVIVTSRDRNILGGGGETMQLEELSNKEAINLLKSSLADLRENEAAKLAHLLQYYPLVLQQAIAYINEQRDKWTDTPYTVSDYIKEFESDIKKFEKLGKRLNGIDYKYQKTTLIVWDKTLKMMSESAMEILKIVAFLDPDNIERDILEKLCVHYMKKEDFESGIRMIFNYCLLKKEETSSKGSVHRIFQQVMRLKVDKEYSKNLFDHLLMDCGMYGKHGERPTESELAHLKHVCKLAWKCDLEMDYFYDVILFLLQNDRLDCAVKYIYLKFPHIKFWSDQSKIRDKLEKVVFWAMCNYSDSVTDEMIEMCSFNVKLNVFNHRIKSLESILKISRKHLGDMSKITCGIRKRLVRIFCEEVIVEKAIELCEQLLPFRVKKSREYYGIIILIVKQLDDLINCTHLIERISNIVDHFGEIFPNSIFYVELKSRIFDLEGDFEKALEQMQEFFNRLNQIKQFWKINRNIKCVRHRFINCFKKEIEIRIKLSKSKREIEKEISKLNIHDIPLRGLGAILQVSEAILGKNHLLTVHVKMKMIVKLKNHDNEKELRLILCIAVLISTVEEQHHNAFLYLCTTQDIHLRLNVQKNILEDLLQNKSITKKNILKKILAKLNEKISFYEKLKEPQESEAKVKLGNGDFANIKTRNDIYKEFGDFYSYKFFTIEQLKRILVLYVTVLGESDKLTLIVKNILAEALVYNGNAKAGLKLLFEVYNSGGDHIQIDRSIDLFQKMYRQFYCDGIKLFQM